MGHGHSALCMAPLSPLSWNISHLSRSSYKLPWHPDASWVGCRVALADHDVSQNSCRVSIKKHTTQCYNCTSRFWVTFIPRTSLFFPLEVRRRKLAASTCWHIHQDMPHTINYIVFCVFLGINIIFYLQALHQPRACLGVSLTKH